MADDPTPELRQISDARTLRALAHPVRIALIDALMMHGPLTATEVGDLIGESPTTCSFHLRQLAKYDVVEEAGGGKGRARPWRMSSIGLRLSGDSDDAETAIASNAVIRLFRERQAAHYQTWISTRSNYPAEWREAADEAAVATYLTAEELEALNEQVVTLLLHASKERLTDPSSRPPGALPVEIVMFSYPLSPPPAGAG
jgi:DNA-binding transcriptional ArsR family regulator